jgi:hypothetical protein
LLRKIGKIIITVLLIAGCATGKNINSIILCGDWGKIIENTVNNNITESGFYIQKGRLNLKSEKEKVGLYFSVKYARKNKYLISLKGKSGIEALRIFISNDTLLVNDRINRELLYGRPEDFERITGIPVELLKVIFGDVPEYNLKVESPYQVDKKEEIRVEGYFKGLKYYFNVNCRLQKMSNLIISTGLKEENIIVSNNKFRGDNKLIPVETSVYDPVRKIKIEIRNQKFIIPWYGDIEFIPGANFKKRHI